MTKRFTAILLTLALLLTMAGCSAANAVQKLDAAGDKVEAKLDAVEDSVENAVRLATAPAPEAAAPTEAPASAAAEAPAPAATEAPAPAEAPAAISGAEAEEIALNYVGLSADQVSHLRSEYEIDDRIPQYDVEFHDSKWEYEFEISAKDGKILSYDKDSIYD